MDDLATSHNVRHGYPQPGAAAFRCACPLLAKNSPAHTYRQLARTSFSTVFLIAGSVLAEQTIQTPRMHQRGAHWLSKSQHVPMRQGPRAHHSAPCRAASCARHGLGTHSGIVCQHSRGSSSSIGGTAKVLHRGCPHMAASSSAQPRSPAVCAASRQEEPQRQNQQQSLDLPREQDVSSPGGQHWNTLVLLSM